MSRRTVLTPVLVATLALAVLSPIPHAHADDQGVLHTASLQWDSADSATAIWTGGAPVAFDPRQTGWTSAPFASLGEFGLARTTTDIPSKREQFLTRNEVVTIEQGLEHTMALDNTIIISSVKRVNAAATITARGNSIRYDLSFEDQWPDSLPGQRVYWNADFAAGTDVVFDTSNPSVLIVSDSTGERSPTVLHISATHGEALWAGRAVHTDALVDGAYEVTGYVRNITEGSTDVTIHAFVLDQDPCATSEVLEFAATVAADPSTWFGEVLPVSSECLTTSAWEFLTDQQQPQEFLLTLDPAASDPAGSSRHYLLQGLPAFVSATVDSTVSPATVSLEQVDTAVTGDYPVTVTSYRTTTTGDQTVRSDPIPGQLTLTVSKPPPPEPEPTPVVQPASPASNPVSSGGRDDDRDTNRDEDVAEQPLAVPAAPVAPPRVPQAIVPPEQQEPTEFTPEPDFQLQESDPPTPLPSSPQLPESTESMTSPTLNLWQSMWWVWVAGGIGLLWWVLLVARRRRDRT